MLTFCIDIDLSFFSELLFKFYPILWQLEILAHPSNDYFRIIITDWFFLLMHFRWLFWAWILVRPYNGFVKLQHCFYKLNSFRCELTHFCSSSFSVLTPELFTSFCIVQQSREMREILKLFGIEVTFSLE